MTTPPLDRVRRIVHSREGLTSREVALLVGDVSTKGVANLLRSESSVYFDHDTSTWRRCE